MTAAAPDVTVRIACPGCTQILHLAHADDPSVDEDGDVTGYGDYYDGDAGGGVDAPLTRSAFYALSVHLRVGCPETA